MGVLPQNLETYMNLIKDASVIGIGKLGLCFALTLEKAGYDVVGLDINKDYVDSINNKSLKSEEQHVEDYLTRSVNFRATIDINEAINHSNLLFVVVATPSLPNGRYDHSQVDYLVDKIISLGKKENKHFVVCCTTMPTYCDTIQERLKEYGYTVSYNPEFIAQGTIIRDQARPDMVLIGEGSIEAGNLIQDTYINMTDNEPRICRMSRTEAEICKISLNCFLTTKIAFANMIGDIAIKSGCNPDAILEAIGSDTRVGNKYIKYGYGYGGPCFPRDNRALSIYSGDLGLKALISVASDESNIDHLKNQVDFFIENNSKDTVIEFDYVSYKPESTMLVESQQLKYAVSLAENGYKVVINERESVIKELQITYGDLLIYKERK
jgi:nucleotide sugar dehydrogenase